MSLSGAVSGSLNFNYADQVCASNGGLSDCVALQNSDIPTLSISATKPEVSRSGAGDPGLFTITRFGNPTGALVVRFLTSGSAVRDIDYTLDAVGGTVSGDTLTMPPNQTSVTVNVRPISNSPGAGDKSAIITLPPDASNIYFVNEQANRARVLILDDINPQPSCAATPTDLAAWYRAEDAADDFVGSRDGTLRGGAGFAQGKVGQSFSLDGADDDVDLGSFSPGSQWTVEAWVRPNATPSGRRAILGGFADCNDWGITMENGQFGVVIKPPSGCTQTISSGVAANTNEWSHVVATNDGVTARIYVNGQERASGAVAANYIGYAASVRIGSEACCGSFFPGLIDEASIYTRALSPSEVGAIYAQGSGGKCTSAAAPSPTPTPSPTPALSLSAITPDKGGDEGKATATIYGASIQPGASVKLSRAGQEDIHGTGATIAANGFSVTTTFNLTGREYGAWNVVVTNPDNQTATLPGAFTIQQAKGAQVWVDVVGRYTFRSGLTERFYIAYGNRGDVDTEPTMVRVYIPAGLVLENLPTLADGSVPAILPEGGGTALEFYLKGIAAGSSSYLPINLTADPGLAHQNVKIRAFAMSSPALQQTVDVQPDPTLTYTSELVEKTDNYSKIIIRGNSATDNFDIVHEVMIEDDTQARPQTLNVVKNGDTVQYIFSVSVAQTSSAAALSQMAHRARPQGQYKKVSEVITRKYTKEIDGGTLFKQVTWMNVNRKLLIECMTRKKWIVTGEEYTDRLPAILTLRITHTIERRDNQPDILRRDQVFDQGLWNFITIVLGPNQLVFMMDKETIPPVVRHWIKRAYSRQWDKDVLTKLMEVLIRECSCVEGAAGSQAHAKGLRPENIVADIPSCNTCSGGRCQVAEKEVKLEVIFSFDPNDKVGTQGAGEQRYVTGNEPINYSIFFENKPEASAPAQKVVITDRLDTSKLDLSTFSLGAFSFGDTVVSVPPGLSDYTTDVDLRPAKNLIVRINSELDDATGLLTVQFTSLDPSTMQPTTDPLAGFLPPNDNSPEGQGSVIFSIAPKSNLATGDEIRNRARIIFDQNEPIDTPEWLNTIDKSRPTSQVAPLAATNCGSFEVSWAGTDTGSGVESYSVYVSENGGPYTVWQLDTTETHATFTGQPGKSYSFYSVARDGTGNTEDAPANADATTTLSGAEALSVTAPPDKTFETAADAASCGLLIDDAALGSAMAAGGCPTPTLARNGVPEGNIFPVGTTIITYTVTDASGGSATAEQQITVLDKTPPAIGAVSVDKTDLWPANHKMVDITLSYDVLDNCDGQSGITRTITVTSNEPVDGTGDGDTSPDWEVIDANSLRLRAERSGNGQGRIYTITINAKDSKGSSSSRSVTVKVPKSK